MLLPSEVEAKAIIPALRAIIAKKLVQRHDMPQQRIASLLGVTQAAVSNYLRETRGKGFSLEGSIEVQSITDDIVCLMNEGANSIAIRSKLHDAANLVKKQKLLCSAHQMLEPSLDVEKCHICESKAT